MKKIFLKRLLFRLCSFTLKPSEYQLLKYRLEKFDSTLAEVALSLKYFSHAQEFDMSKYIAREIVRGRFIKSSVAHCIPKMIRDSKIFTQELINAVFKNGSKCPTEDGGDTEILRYVIEPIVLYWPKIIRANIHHNKIAFGTGATLIIEKILQKHKRKVA